MADHLLYRATRGPDAFLLKALLEEHGVPAEVRGSHLMGLLGAIPARDAMPTVWVTEAHRAAALDVLVRFTAPAGTRPEWVCAACEEENPGTFDVCWRCGAAFQLTVLEGGRHRGPQHG